MSSGSRPSFTPISINRPSRGTAVTIAGRKNDLAMWCRSFQTPP